MNHLLSILILFLAVLTCQGQYDSGLSLKNNSDFTLEAGSSFTAGSGFSGSSLFIRPALSKPITRRFSIQAGTMFQSYHLFSAQNSELSSMFPAYSLSLFGMGSFELNDKITVYGGYMHTKPVFSKSGKDLFAPGNTFFGGIDYRMNNNNTLGIRVAYSKDNNSLFQYPSMFRQGSTDYFPGNSFLYGY